MKIEHIDKARELSDEREQLRDIALDLAGGAHSLCLSGRSNSLAADRYLKKDALLYRALAEVARAHLQGQIDAIEAEMVAIGLEFEPIKLELSIDHAKASPSP